MLGGGYERVLIFLLVTGGLLVTLMGCPKVYNSSEGWLAGVYNRGAVPQTYTLKVDESTVEIKTDTPIPRVTLDNLNKTKEQLPDKISVWTDINNTNQDDIIGRENAITIGIYPINDKRASVGGDSQDRTGSYRIPSVTKINVDGKTRLLAAFDVRYRGRFTGDGDVGQEAAFGSDIAVMYSDDGGQTWINAEPVKPLSTAEVKPAMDVDNGYDEIGKSQTQSQQKTLDVCDAQLTVHPDGTIYLGAAGGTGNFGNGSTSNFRVFKSTDNGETWYESPKSDANNTREDSFRNVWGNHSVGLKGGLKHVMTTPGHGIILTRDVPNTPGFKAGQAVMPVFNNWSNNSGNYGIYLATGVGEPENWDSNGFSPAQRWNNYNIEEGVVCQLDDGSLLLYSKCAVGKAQFSRFVDNGWESVTEDPKLIKGNGGQVSILKIAEGNGVDKCGVVAFTYSVMTGTNASSKAQGNAGRGDVTVCFARDMTGLKNHNSTHPLDVNEPYFLKLRTQKQSYFGYTDLVMIDKDTLGVLYENYSSTDQHGMKFARIDVSEIITKLSALPNTEGK